MLRPCVPYPKLPVNSKIVPGAPQFFDRHRVLLRTPRILHREGGLKKVFIGVAVVAGLVLIPIGLVAVNIVASILEAALWVVAVGVVIGLVAFFVGRKTASSR